MMVLGIDPGIEKLGYCMAQYSQGRLESPSYGLISTSKDCCKPERLLQIYQDLKSLFIKYKPEAVSVEKLIFAKNVTTALVISEVRGVIILLTAEFQLPLYEFTPLEVKMSLTGYGRSSKSQIQHAVKLILSLPEIPKPDDVADAIAIAICGLNAINFQKKIALNSK
jgi:crossover junction endodeoxyribonuclease RuvC